MTAIVMNTPQLVIPGLKTHLTWQCQGPTVSSGDKSRDHLSSCFTSTLSHTPEILLCSVVMSSTVLSKAVLDMPQLAQHSLAPRALAGDFRGLEFQIVLSRLEDSSLLLPALPPRPCLPASSLILCSAYELGNPLMS